MISIFGITQEND